jgi:hypothetical protein
MLGDLVGRHRPVLAIPGIDPGRHARQRVRQDPHVDIEYELARLAPFFQQPADDVAKELLVLGELFAGGPRKMLFLAQQDRQTVLILDHVQAEFPDDILQFASGRIRGLQGIGGEIGHQ